MNEVYEQLAERNGWSYSLDDNRPYFMKDGKYAVPDETTSDDDKELLAHIISEGSDEMKGLILLCWDNNVTISGPCSGIRGFHKDPPYSLHFSFKANKELIDPLYSNLQEILPTFRHLYREEKDEIRYDVDYALNEKELSKEESDKIFKVIKDQLQLQLEKENNKDTTIH